MYSRHGVANALKDTVSGFVFKTPVISSLTGLIIGVKFSNPLAGFGIGCATELGRWFIKHKQAIEAEKLAKQRAVEELAKKRAVEEAKRNQPTRLVDENGDELLFYDRSTRTFSSYPLCLDDLEDLEEN